MISIGRGELQLESDTALLRSALALSSATGEAFRWERFGRRGTGLTELDAESIRAIASIHGLEVDGGAAGDDFVAIRPPDAHQEVSNDLRVAVAPSAALVPLVRVAILPLARVGDERRVTFTGSTHAPGGETFEVVDSTFHYLLERLGVDASFSLESAGFAPRGGGEIAVRVGPSRWAGIELVNRAPLERIGIVSAGPSLPAHVQQRQAARARSGVHIAGFEPTVQLLKIRARSAGSVIAVTGYFGELPITFASVSERGKSAESVGEQAAAAFRRYAKQPGVVPEGLVDSLVVFLALAEGESSFSVARLPRSLPGQRELIRAFTGRDVHIDGKPGHQALVRVGP